MFFVNTGNVPSGWNNKQQYSQLNVKNVGGSDDINRNLANYISQIPDTRISQDIATWRKAIKEMEDPILPYRYLSQNAYKDVVLDPQIFACIDRRKKITLLKNFEVKDENGLVDVKWTKYFNNNWFNKFVNFVLDSEFYGYSLIAMGDITDNHFDNINIIRRTHTSPDRLNVSAIAYSPNGIEFTKEPYNQSHIYISTPNEHGLSSCGYGLLYVLTPLYILLKNNTAWNGAYNEIFGMPLRHLKTNKNSDAEHMEKMSDVMDQMSSKPWIITSVDDDLQMIEGGKGSGYKTYSDLEIRTQRLISKIILGHSDAVDSAGKTSMNNSSTGIAQSPQNQALADVEAYDGRIVCDAVNNKLFPLMRVNGINIPTNLTFGYTNDLEIDLKNENRNNENLKISKILSDLEKSGYTIEPDELSKIMQIKIIKK